MYIYVYSNFNDVESIILYKCVNNICNQFFMQAPIETFTEKHLILLNIYITHIVIYIITYIYYIYLFVYL